MLKLSNAQFEGVIEASTYTKVTNDEANVKWFLKDGNSRLDISGTTNNRPYSNTLLFRKGDNSLYMYGGTGENKSLFKVPQDSITTTKLANASVSITGRKKNIAGYVSYFVKIESPEGTTECWVTDELSLEPESFPPSLRSKGVIGIIKTNGLTGIPVAVISRDTNGEIHYSFEIKSVTAKSLDVALFEVPVGYQKGEEQIKKSLQVE